MGAVSSKPRKKKSKAEKPKKPSAAEIELEPDAMERFERAIGVMAPVRRKKVGKK